MHLLDLIAVSGIMEGTALPNYTQCVSIVTREVSTLNEATQFFLLQALREMVKPALLALVMPVLVGFGFRFLGI